MRTLLSHKRKTKSKPVTKRPPFKRDNKEDLIVSVDEYRKLLNDKITPDERVKERIWYLAALTRKIIKSEIERHAGKTR